MAYDSESPDTTANETESETPLLRADWREYDSPATAIIETVATAKGLEPTDLPPLIDSVDPDAIDNLVERSASNDRYIRVSFAYDGVTVGIESNGEIKVQIDEEAVETPKFSPQTDLELNAELKQLLAESARNGISVCGGWAIRNGPELPDWDIHITQVTKSDERDTLD